MPADAFFDTAIVVYASLDDAQRSPAAQQLLEAGGVINVQVLNEYVSVMRAKYSTPWPRIREGIATIRELCECHPLTELVHERAVELAARYNFHIYDASILAAALEAGCTILYTEDLQDGQRIHGLTVRNPFPRKN